MVCLILFAFAIRVYAVRWRLPYVDHPDEPNLINYVVHTLETGDLNPHVFRKPTLYFYLLVGVLGIHYQLGLASGVYTSLDQMNVTTHLYTTIPGFFVWGRMLTVVFGTATVPLVYALGKRSWNYRAGLFAALFIATSSFHMRNSQYVTTDVACAWFAALTFVAILAMVQQPTWRAYAIAGFLAGLIAATKYNAGAIVLPLIAGHLMVWKWQAFRNLPRLIVAGAAAIGGFVLAMPYVVLDWDTFIRDMSGEARGYADGSRGNFHGAWNVAGYVDFFWNDGTRPVATAALVIGIGVMLWRRRTLGLVWLSFAVPYMLILLSQQVHFVRNLMPLFVLCALPIGIVGAELVTWLQGHFRQPLAVLATIFTVLLFAFQGWDAITFTRFEASPGSQLLASTFVRNLPQGQRIAVELNGVEWSTSPIVQPVSSLVAHPLEWYRANTYRYLVANKAFQERRDAPLYEALRANTTQLKVFPGDDAGQPGPYIEVLEIPPQPDALQIVPRPAQFGTVIKLLGYEAQAGDPRPAISPIDGADQHTFIAGQNLQLNLTWQALGLIHSNYALFVHVVDEAGNTVAQRDTLVRGDDYPTGQWQPNEIVVDRADTPLGALVPGTYKVVIGLYLMDTFERLPLAQPEPDSDGSSLVLTTFTVE